MKLIFAVHMRPVPKGRPRFANGRVYTPAHTAAAERAIAFACKKAMKEQGWPSGFDGFVDMNAWFYYAKPKSNKRNFPTVCDLDNIVKCCQDSLNGLAYKDDRLIVGLSASKHWGPEDKIVIEIQEAK